MVSGLAGRADKAGENPPPERPEILPEHLGLRTVYQSDQSEIDIIAVHGIGADPTYTWKMSGSNGASGVDWLKDLTMLQNAIPQARIMKFGYQSQWFGKDAVTTNVSNIAEELMMSLESNRRNCTDRPIIFIGHCFGGLVIEKTLTLAKLYDSEILPATSGIVFLGTPHFGTGEITSSGLLYRAIASAPSLHVEGAVLKNIEQGSEVLTSIHSEFMILCNRNDFKICCFFEQKITDVGVIINQAGLKEFIVDRKSSCIPGYPSRGLPLDHFRMSKFTGPDDGNYHAVRDEILKMAGMPSDSRVSRKRAEQRWSEEDDARRRSPYFAGSTFSGNNSGSRINQVGTVAGNFTTG